MVRLIENCVYWGVDRHRLKATNVLVCWINVDILNTKYDANWDSLRITTMKWKA